MSKHQPVFFPNDDTQWPAPADQEYESMVCMDNYQLSMLTSQGQGWELQAIAHQDVVTQISEQQPDPRYPGSTLYMQRNVVVRQIVYVLRKPRGSYVTNLQNKVAALEGEIRMLKTEAKAVAEDVSKELGAAGVK